MGEARAQLDAGHAQIAGVGGVAFTACGQADDLGEKLSEREGQIAARDEADAKVLRVEADWYRARRSVADYIAGMTDRFLELAHRRRLGTG